MAIYKRYNTRRRRVRWGLVFWVLGILLIFTITAIVGHNLGKKAEGGESLLKEETNSLEGSALKPLVQIMVRGKYVEAKELSTFVVDGEGSLASVWLYDGKSSDFSLETNRLLGYDLKGKTKLSAFDNEADISGLFTVRSIYEDAEVRDIVAAYEHSLLGEFEASGLDEIVLIFDEINQGNMEDIFTYAENVKGAKIIALPYDILKSDICARFFSEANSRQLSVALTAPNLKKKQLEKDIEDYAFYFTRYNIRLLLEGEDAHLCDVLKEKGLENYQFVSAVSEE